MKTTLILTFCLCICSFVQAQPAGPNNGTQSSNFNNGYQTWSNESNIASSDDAYAEIGNIAGSPGSFSDYLVVTGFNFDLPDGVTVFGVRVEIERSDPNQLTSDYSIRLTHGGLMSTDDRSTGSAFPATDAYQTYGGSTDCWGDEISYKDVDNADFGVAIAVQRNGTGGQTAGRIDNIRITVYYAFVTLPVTILSFNALKHDESVKISWTTSVESEISKYIVERSLDAKDFREINTVGSKNVPGSTYKITDERPLPGLSYYRLKILEENGLVKYSSISSVFLASVHDMKLSPSPWTGGKELFISNPGKEKVTVRFFNAMGNMVAHTQTDNRIVPAEALAEVKGLLYYKVYDTNNRILSSGNLMVY